VSWKHWAVLVLLVVGFVRAEAWVLGLLLFEFGVRKGRDVAAFWAVGHINRD